MARKLSVDMAELSRPISDLLPSGESLRRSAVYDKIKEARRAEDPNLSQGVWVTDVKKADWGESEKLCLDILRSKSKDLRVAGWLTEAWLNRYGVEGATEGLRVIDSLITRFWDTVYPPLDEDGDLDGRMAPVAWLNDKLTVQLKRTVLTEPQTQEPQLLTWLDWERASMYDRQNRKPPEGESSTADFMSSVLLTPADFYRKRDAEIADLIAAANALEASVDKRCGQPMAALWQFKEMAEQLKAFVGRALDQKGEDEPEIEDAEDLGVDVGDDAGSKGVRFGAIRNRAEAYQRLAEAAHYLIAKEPHSPVPHLILRAVSWGNMSFGELVQELVSDQRDVGQIFELLGMVPKE